MKRLRPVLVAGLLLLAGCTTAPQTSQLLASDTALPASRIDGVAFFPQSEDQCGPAALASVLTYRGVDTTPEALRPQIYLSHRGGSLQSDLIAASRSHGLLPYRLDGNLDTLLQELAAGNPVLVLQNLGLDWLPRWHYAVAIGYDPASQEIILHSGEQQALRRPLDLFEQTWARGGHWALAITSPTTPPATASADGLLRTALALEEVGQNRAAIDAYQALTRRWPTRTAGWVALGNGLYGAGRFEQSLQAYQQALRLDSQAPLVWNNQAYTLNALACGGQAIASLHCGLRLDPANPQLLESLDELRDAGSRQAEHCPIVLCL